MGHLVIDINKLEMAASKLRAIAHPMRIAIIDCNNNGKWDTGNYLLKRQAEKIKDFKNILDLGPNWEMEENWVIN